MLDALWLSLRTTLMALAIIVVFGTPAAYLLATRTFRGHALVSRWSSCRSCCRPRWRASGCSPRSGRAASSAAPRKTPDPARAGDRGRRRRAGFVAAPFYIRGAQTAFAAVDRAWLEASRTLGAARRARSCAWPSPPPRPGMLAGLALAWGRALGEFGATLMFAGLVPRHHADRAAGDLRALRHGLHGALALSAVLVVVSCALLLSVKLLGGQGAAAVLRVEARTRLGDFDLDVARRGAARQLPRAGRALRRGQEHGAADRRRAAAPRRRPRVLRRGGLAGHARGSSSRPSGAAAATSSRTTRCSPT